MLCWDIPGRDPRAEGRSEAEVGLGRCGRQKATSDWNTSPGPDGQKWGGGGAGVVGAQGHVWGHPVERSEWWQVAGLDPRGIQRQDETFQFEQLNLAMGQRA